jgi:hypothetical protein
MKGTVAMTLRKALPAAAALGAALAVSTWPAAAFAMPPNPKLLLHPAAPDPDPPVSGVPEPATWALMFLGIGAVGAVLRASRHRTHAGLSDAEAPPQA